MILHEWKKMASHRLVTAKEDLESAYILLKANQYRGANNRAYYCIYHAIDAVLILEGKAFKRHKDTLAYFNKNYVASKIFPRELGKRIVKAEEIRHASDYDTFYIASKEVTKTQIETAELLVRLVELYISNKEQEEKKMIIFIDEDTISKEELQEEEVELTDLAEKDS